MPNERAYLPANYERDLIAAGRGHLLPAASQPEPAITNAEIELEIRIIESSASFLSAESRARIAALRAIQFARRDDA